MCKRTPSTIGPVSHKNTTISEPLNSQPSLAEISTESVSGHSNQDAYQVSMAQFVPKTRLPKLSLLKFNAEITNVSINSMVAPPLGVCRAFSTVLVPRVGHLLSAG
jgi:hypothetical protein